MKQQNIFWAYSLFVVCSLFPKAASADDTLKTSVEVSQGYRHDKLVFKNRTYGSFYSPAHTFHYKFKDINIYSSRVAFTVSKNDFFGKAVIGYGDVHKGKISSYRLAETIDDGYTADFGAKFGKSFRREGGWTISPVVGYGVYMQKFHIKPNTYRWGTHDIYRATWYSPQVGVVVQKAFTPTCNASLEYDFLFPLSFQAKSYPKGHHARRFRYENQNKAYKSFGNIATFGIDWNFAQNWSLKPEFEFMKFYAKHGESYRYSRSLSTTRTAYEVRLTLGYGF